MSREIIEIAAVPYNESCEQCGTENYDPAHARRECRAFINQLERQFPQVEESGAYFKIVSRDHDFGTYYEVGVSYDESNEDQIKIAYLVEEEAPSEWDEIAKQELGLVVV